MTRLGTVEDHGQLEAILTRASLANEGDREVLLAHPEWLTLPKSQLEGLQVLVVESDGVTVGFASVIPREDGEYELDGLFVDPPYWNQGFGSILVRAAAELVSSLGESNLYVVGNPHAKLFYEKNGFQFIADAPTEFGNGLVMRKEC